MGLFQSSPVNADLRWCRTIDLATFINSYETYKTHFDEKITMEAFAEKLSNAKYDDIDLEILLDYPGLENLGRERLQARTIEEAYPEDDRPRGYEGDIVRVRQLIDNEYPTSPVVIVGHPSNPVKAILLDGMHRLVAAKFKAGGLHAKIRVCTA